MKLSAFYGTKYFMSAVIKSPPFYPNLGLLPPLDEVRVELPVK
jgi:hypothetical protein